MGYQFLSQKKFLLAVYNLGQEQRVKIDPMILKRLNREPGMLFFASGLRKPRQRLQTLSAVLKRILLSGCCLKYRRGLRPPDRVICSHSVI